MDPLSSTAVTCPSVTRKLRSVMFAAMYKIHKNRFKDMTVYDKWPKEAHDEHNGRTWLGADKNFLVNKLLEETNELIDAFRNGYSKVDVLLEAGDTMALAMMCVDRYNEGDEAGLPPKIICLCGSTKFKDAFIEANKKLTLEGNIVLSVGCFPHVDDKAAPEDVLGESVKEQLDFLHKRKIDLADEILVLNVGGYVGSSTRSEIEHAKATGKPIHW